MSLAFFQASICYSGKKLRVNKLTIKKGKKNQISSRALIIKIWSLTEPFKFSHFKAASSLVHKNKGEISGSFPCLNIVKVDPPKEFYKTKAFFWRRSTHFDVIALFFLKNGVKKTVNAKLIPLKYSHREGIEINTCFIL